MARLKEQIMQKLIDNKYLIYGLIFTSILSYFFIKYTGGDSTFPIYGNFSEIIKNKFLYLWSNDVYGTTTVIDKLRLFPIFILNSFSLYSKELFFLIFNLLGFFSFYFASILFFGVPKTSNHKLLLVLLSILFVFNPLSIFHHNHTFLVQGYLLYPIILGLYYKYLITSGFINKYIIIFLIFILFLGQPHNYYNIALSGFILTLIIFLTGNISFLSLIKKSFLSLLLTLLTLSFIILTFSFTTPNDLTSSVGNFSGTSPNLIWSSNQGVLNTFIFKLSSFEKYTYLGYIIYLINIFLFGFFLLNKNKNKNILLLLFISLLSLSFIGKNPLLNNDLKEFIYKIIPHLRIDVAYILLIFVPFFYLLINYTIVKNNKLFSLTKSLLLISIFINIVIFLNYNQKDSRYDIGKYSTFVNWIANGVNSGTISDTIIVPNSVTYVFPGVSDSIYGSMPFDKVSNLNSVYFWPFSELMLKDTKKFISNKFDKIDYLSKTNIKYILCFGDYCNMLKNKNYIFLSSLEKYSLYEYLHYKKLFDGNNFSFQKQNPTKYKLNLKNISSAQDLSFLQSFHKEWKLYLKSNQDSSWCNPIERYNNDGKNIIECEHNQEFFQGEELSYLYKKPLFENTHHLVYDYANGWEISKDEIIKYVDENYGKELQKEGYPKTLSNGVRDYKYYTLNSDGSIDVELTLYFKPQSYFYLGLIISGTTFIVLVGYLGYDFIRSRRKEEIY